MHTVYSDQYKQSQQEKPKPTEAQETEFVTIPMGEFIALTQAATLLSVVVNDETFHHTALPAVKTTLEALVENQEAGAEE